MAELPPHDIDAEEAVIGSLLIDGNTIHQVASLIKPDSFYSERNAQIYSACLSLYQRNEVINQITLAQELARVGKLDECGGAAYLSHLISIVPTSLDIEHYAGIVKRFSVSRQMIMLGKKLEGIGRAAEPDVNDSLHRAKALMNEMVTSCALGSLEPVFDNQAGVYSTRWMNSSSEPFVSISLTNLKQRGDAITAEISVGSSGSGEEFTGLVFNVTSPTARNNMVRKLKEINPAVNWLPMLDKACTNTIKAYRQGEPLTKLSENVVVASDEWQLQPVLQAGEIHTLYGPGGSVKSHIAVYFAAMIQCGIAHLHFAPTPGNVLILDYESSKSRWAYRYKAHCVGLNVPDIESPVYRRCHLPLVQEQAEIYKMVKDNEISLVILDSVNAAVEDDPNKATNVTALYNAVRGFETTVLLIDHVNKQDKGLYGAVVKRDRSRSVFKINAHERRDQNYTDVTFIHDKLNDGLKLRPFVLRFNFHMSGERLDAVHVSKTDMFDTQTVFESMSCREKVIACMRKMRTSVTVNDLSNHCGDSADTVRQTLNRYKNAQFIQLSDGKWGLLERNR